MNIDFVKHICPSSTRHIHFTNIRQSKPLVNDDFTIARGMRKQYDIAHSYGSFSGSEVRIHHMNNFMKTQICLSRSTFTQMLRNRLCGCAQGDRAFKFWTETVFDRAVMVDDKVMIVWYGELREPSSFGRPSFYFHPLTDALCMEQPAKKKKEEEKITTVEMKQYNIQ